MPDPTSHSSHLNNQLLRYPWRVTENRPLERNAEVEAHIPHWRNALASSTSSHHHIQCKHKFAVETFTETVITSARNRHPRQPVYLPVSPLPFVKDRNGWPKNDMNCGKYSESSIKIKHEHFGGYRDLWGTRVLVVLAKPNLRSPAPMGGFFRSRSQLKKRTPGFGSNLSTE